MHLREKVEKLQEEVNILLGKESSLIEERQVLEEKVSKCIGEIKKEAIMLVDKVEESSECEESNPNIYSLKEMFHKKAETICKKFEFLYGLRTKISKIDYALEQIKNEREEKKQLIEANGDAYLFPLVGEKGEEEEDNSA